MQLQVVRGPIRVLDASPTCDGAAAIVLTSNRDAALKGGAGGLVRLSGSGAASDILCVADRPDPLSLGLPLPPF
jgi:acetyl-CoA C-acetyltransferase